MSARLATITANLWPRAPYSPWFVAGARNRAVQAYGKDAGGQPLDVGALRDAPAGVEVLTAEGWRPYNEGAHQFIANVFSRVGPGWSFGSNSIHNSARAWFAAVHNRMPDPMENVDIQFNKALFESLRSQFHALTGTPPPPPEPEPVPPPRPDPPRPEPPVAQPPAAGSLHALSPAERRAEELRTLLSENRTLLPGGPKVEEAISRLLGEDAWKSFTKVPAVELIRVWRLLRRKLGDAREIPQEDRS